MRYEDCERFVVFEFFVFLGGWGSSLNGRGVIWDYFLIWGFYGYFRNDWDLERLD